jgi:predicted phosphodiesterase
MRIFALSDLHVDYDVNAQWIDTLSQVEYLNDVLVLAGDISGSVARLERCVGLLARRFKKVLFVPGNHDLWIMRGDTQADSLDKFHRVCQIAMCNGASMSPYHHGRLSIVPLLGWYDFSFGMPEAALQRSWMDFQACRWPGLWSMADVTSHFLQMNNYRRHDDDEIIVSFSHFLPRLDVIPPLVSRNQRYLLPVLGAARLEQQVRELGSAIHIYGHSHLNRSVPLDGTLYVNNAYGYPHEAHIAAKKLRCVYECR